MAWPKGRPRRIGVEQGNAIEGDIPAVSEAARVEGPVPDAFEAFCAWAEAQRPDVVVTRVEHPSVPGERTHWDGLRSGFPVAQGPAFVRWSDGSSWPDSAIALQSQQ